MNNTKFSIIISVYNTKIDYIKEAIDSAININYQDYEIILVDDASNNEVKCLLNDYKDTCRIITHKTNKGGTNSMIEGVEKAKGDYICFIDFDDHINPNALNVYDSIIKEHQPDIIMHDFALFTDSINDIKKHAPFFSSEGFIDKDEVFKQLCLQKMNPMWTRTAKKRLFKDIRKSIIDPMGAINDINMSAYIFTKANNFYYTNNLLYYYRSLGQHRDYYDIKNIKDCDYLKATYNILFVDNNCYSDSYKYFRESAINSIIYNAFRICLWINDKKEKRHFLDLLNETDTCLICKTNDAPIPLKSKLLFKLLINKNYFMLYVLAKVYDGFYGMQQL